MAITPIYDLSFRIDIRVYGTISESAQRFRSKNGCLGDDVGFVQFATSEYTVGGNNAPCGIGHKFSITNNEIENKGFYRLGRDEYRILGNVCDAELNLVIDINKDNYNQQGIGNLIYRYCGDDKCIQIASCYNNNVPLSFYIKGGKTLSDGSVDPNNHGDIYYCGQGVAPYAGGYQFFTWEIPSANYPNYGFNLYDSNNDSNALLHVSTITSIDGGQTIDPEQTNKIIFDCNYVPEDNETSEDCSKCSVNINDACNDNWFTSDLEEFSSLRSPEPYINQDNGEEERTSYNAFLHLAKIQRISNKVLFAQIEKISCNLLNQLKELNEALKEMNKKVLELQPNTEVIVSPSENVFVQRVHYNVDAEE